MGPFGHSSPTCAAPVVLSGLRTATVLVVGTATLVTAVGGLSLGNRNRIGSGGSGSLPLRFRLGVTAQQPFLALPQLVHGAKKFLVLLLDFLKGSVG